jgi:hypothetical protein
MAAQAQELLCVVTADWKPRTSDGFKARKAERKAAKKIVVNLRLKVIQNSPTRSEILWL